MIFLVIQIPIIWLFIAAAALGAGALVRKRLRTKRGSIAVLGPKGSGKTTFLNYLRKINTTASEGTGVEPYKTFKFKLNDGKIIKIKSGKDIGGGANYKELYQEMIKDCDAIIIIFDINRYLFDKKKTEEDKRTYQELTHVRFQFIRNTYKEIYGNIKTSCFVVIGSHKDQTEKNDNNLKELFWETIKEKPYKDALLNCHFCNLTDKNDMNKLVNDIFGKNIFSKK